MPRLLIVSALLALIGRRAARLVVGMFDAASLVRWAWAGGFEAGWRWRR